MHKHPTDGVKGSRPRVPDAGGNGKVAKSELAKLNREYLTTRNRQQLAKAQSAEMALEERRGELISKEVVVRQAAFIFVSLRQAVLNFPSRYAHRILNIADPPAS